MRGAEGTLRQKVAFLFCFVFFLEGDRAPCSTVLPARAAGGMGRTLSVGLILLGPGALTGIPCHQIHLGFSFLLKGDAARKLVPSACELMVMNLVL